jgi:glycine oxidase
MGCTTALALSERGADVVLLERAVPGAEASSAAAGILGAQVELHGRADCLELYVRARTGWTEWARALREASGIDIGHRTSGVLRVARTGAESEAAAAEVAWNTARGLRASLLDAAAAREVEPELAPDLIAAAYFPDDAQVDPPALLRALMAAAVRSSRVSIRAGETVHRLLVEHDRCVGVALDDWCPASRPRSRSCARCAARWSCSTNAHRGHARSSSAPARTSFPVATAVSFAARRWSMPASGRK